MIPLPMPLPAPVTTAVQDPDPNDPHPARSSATLSAFTGQVQRVLRLLGEWLPEDQVDRTLEQLPGGSRS